MYCPQCGNNLGTEKNCSRCGWSEEGKTPENAIIPLDETPAEEAPTEEMARAAAPLGTAPMAAGNAGNAQPVLTVGQIRNMLASPLMLTLCVLVSVSALFGLLSGKINVFAVLYAIAFWIAYSAARSLDTELKPGGLKMNYYVCKAFMIVMWVAVGFVALGVVLASLGAMFGASIPALHIFGKGIAYFPRTGSFYGLSHALPFPFDAAAISVSLYLVLIASALLVACALMVVIQIFYFRSLCRFSRSLYFASLNGRGVLIKTKAVRQWSFVLGIISCLSIFAVGWEIEQNLAALSGVCGGAAMIVGSVMMKKYLTYPISDTNMQ
jgi:hypothetical protein